jgi:acyl carrier protein
MKNTKETVIDLIHQFVNNNCTTISREDISEASLVDDLGLDSLDKIELIIDLEKNFSVSIEDEAIEELNTVGEIIEYIESREHTIPETIELRREVNEQEAKEEEKEEEKEEGEIRVLSSEEVEKIDAKLFSRIEDYINENIANWEECCECEEEGDALDFALSHSYPDWRVLSDGTIDVVIHGESRESFDFEWEDEEGEERTSNAFDLLKGYVSHQFDENANNEVQDFYSSGLKDKIKALFK